MSEEIQNIPHAYIMVTNWKGHWDNLSDWNYSTVFRKKMIKFEDQINYPEGKVRTLFIKRTYKGAFEKSWEGYTSGFRKDTYNGDPVIRFDVSDIQEVSCPASIKSYKEGWYQTPVLLRSIQPILGVSEIDPPFFQHMLTCGWKEFEAYCYQLLRVLGIHDIHKFPENDNRGKADGFFRFHSLSVLYDATLDGNLTAKDQQIENYIGQLKKDKISFGKTTYTIKDSHRYVWILTRGGKVEVLRREDGIWVKQVPVEVLMQLYRDRLTDESLDMEELWDRLKDIK